MKAQVHELIVNAGSATFLKTVVTEGAEVLVEERTVPCGMQFVLLSDKPFKVELKEGAFQRTLRSSAS